DISKPEKPREIGFMPTSGLGPHRIWYTGGRYAYASIHFAEFVDHVLAVIDMSDPRKPEVVGRLGLPGMHKAGGETPGWRKGMRYIWMYDIREPANPVSIATFPQPAEADYCKKGGSFGPHNLHENRPGAFQSSKIIFATYYNAGVRVYDIENQFAPKEIGYYV